MASQLLTLRVLGFAALLTFLALTEWIVFRFGGSTARPQSFGLHLFPFVLAEVSGDGKKLHKLFRKRDAAAAAPPAAAAAASSKASVAVSPSKAREFLATLSRRKRNIWDHSRADVQQWIMQFMYMGFDEQRLESDLSYWMDHARSNDHGRQHHYDENAPIGPRDPNSYRHGADVNYDYY